MINTPHSPILCDIAGHALDSPDKIALVQGDFHVSYAQLIDNIEAAACFLQAMGIGKGDRIVLAAQKEVEFVYLYFAAHVLGAINVVVDASSPGERLDYIIDVVKPSAILGTDLKISNNDVIPLQRVNVGDDCGGNLVVPDMKPTDIADVMFTTGTTGVPKGVCLSHANIAGSASNTNQFIGNNSSDIEALALPLSHSFGLGRLRCVLSMGATIILVGNFANLKSFFNVLDNYAVTGFGMVPAVWQYIKRLSGRRIARFAQQLKYIEIGSASLPIEDKQLLLELFPDTRLCMHYGLTEASRAMFSEFHAEADKLSTVGRPVSGAVQAAIFNDEGTPVAAGVDGEICVRGNMVTSAYYKEADNVGAFYGDWFRTGDWGHCDENGYFYLTGRKKELINVGGEKVSPVTIEQAIISLGIDDCACIAVPDPNGILGEVPKVFLQKSGRDQDLEEIKRQVSQLLPPHEVPVLWEWIDRIPRTPSGKIQRLKLKQ